LEQVTLQRETGGTLLHGDESSVRVLLVEDHAIFRELFARTFEWEPGVEVVAQAGSLVEARESLVELSGGVDVAVLDLGLPDGEGTDLIGDLRAENPHAVALVLTANPDLDSRARAIAAGAAGVLHKSASIDEVMDAVRRLASGEVLLSQREVIELLRHADRERTLARETKSAFESLAPREKDALDALAKGMNDKEIAVSLNVGVGTARGYVAGMLRKLGTHSRLQALVLAVRHGYVEI
jgi:DNA-binding NarL/FixJ family response regulator